MSELLVAPSPAEARPEPDRSRQYDWLVVALAALIFLVGCISPPYLQDDVDAVQCNIARTMIETGDWVTPHLDGIRYLEKPPLKYWMIAASFRLFGVHDWAARLPIALSTVLLCLVLARFGRWAFGADAGLYSGLAIATSFGIFLFTRVLIADVVLTLAITGAIWCFLRALDDDEPHPARWSAGFAVAMACAVMLKGLIGLLFPAAAGFLYLVFSGQLFRMAAWRRLRPLSASLLFFLLAAPWHIAATLANPPYFDIVWHSRPGEYHGFFWFYFFNEHLFRFLNLRYPHDYNTVPRPIFWLLHLAWLFPWSGFLPSVWRQSYRPTSRAGRVRLMALCWIGFVLVFFSFSTTQEYYSMPCYPAFALLLGSAMTRRDAWVRWGSRAISSVAGVLALVLGFVLIRVWNLPTPGDIASALGKADETLSLAHFQELTFPAFAYLRLPVSVAVCALLVGAAGLFWKGRGPWSRHQPYLTIAAMMLLFYWAALLALVDFDPYLGSRNLAEVLNRQPPGQLVAAPDYYSFSSVFFYSHREAMLLNGRVNNLEYGSNAPDAQNVFLTDAEFRTRWLSAAPLYLVTDSKRRDQIRNLVGDAAMTLLAESGGKFLFANHARHH